jgi:hypothetical protein
MVLLRGIAMDALTIPRSLTLFGVSAQKKADTHASIGPFFTRIFIQSFLGALSFSG